MANQLTFEVNNAISFESNAVMFSNKNNSVNIEASNFSMLEAKSASISFNYYLNIFKQS